MTSRPLPGSAPERASTASEPAHPVRRTPPDVSPAATWAETESDPAIWGSWADEYRYELDIEPEFECDLDPDAFVWELGPELPLFSSSAPAEADEGRGER